LFYNLEWCKKKAVPHLIVETTPIRSDAMALQPIHQQISAATYPVNTSAITAPTFVMHYNKETLVYFMPLSLAVSRNSP
jgi:hypothetical protein